MLAVAGLGKQAEACCFLQSGVCLRWRGWASKRGHVAFAKRRLLAVAAGGQASRGMLLLRSGGCLRWRVWASKQGLASFAGRRVLAVAGVGELAVACCFLQSSACLRWHVWVSCKAVRLLRRGACLRWQLGASKRGMLLFAKWRVFAVAAEGKQTGARAVCKSSPVCCVGWAGVLANALYLAQGGAC